MADLSSFLKNYDKSVLLALLPIIALTFILDQLFSLEPPWPNGSTYITAFLELCVVFAAYYVDIRSKKKLLVYQRWSILVMFALFIGYFSTYAFFVYDDPSLSNAIIGGFRCTEDAVLVVEAMASESCPRLSFELLASAGYDPELLWEPWSIKIVEISMFAMWSMFFVVAAYMLALTVSFEARKNQRNQR